MYNITLVCTRHDELGKCNSNELYQIIELINPEVIFEEIPPTFFDEYYLDKRRANLETDTINKYIQNHKIEHIPVDSNNFPSEEFFKDHKRMIEKIEGLADINGFTFRNLVDNNKIYTERYGFKYLNSIDSININNEICNALENGLQKINNDKLFLTFKLWKDINDMRENQMLQNIYLYSQDHNYDRAIFTIGAAHRKSIIDKIFEYQKNEKVKLNWIF
ncbi:hypothetical protein [Flavobacterium caseinilyticum]|uniref:Uncharacterized protein n=1 Tax=Flavobacterium caseinilyticum TaxID=2541732 RepID=A0A4R5AYI1_9FLAO|nr:hypothetical protein [Flavobacterium caseinilyticum]TDD77199.1 hypothetical protein E0F89_06265 [Flavobacterium caseinilyticum]